MWNADAKWNPGLLAPNGSFLLKATRLTVFFFSDCAWFWAHWGEKIFAIEESSAINLVYGQHYSWVGHIEVSISQAWERGEEEFWQAHCLQIVIFLASLSTLNCQHSWGEITKQQKPAALESFSSVAINSQEYPLDDPLGSGACKSLASLFVWTIDNKNPSTRGNAQMCV